VSGGLLLEGDFHTGQAFQLGDELAFAARRGEAVVPVGAEVAVAGGGVGEQVPGDGEDGVADNDGDEGSFLSSSLGDPPVTGGQEGAGPGGRGGGLADGATEPGVALPVAAALLRPADWRALGANLAQETRWPGVGK
jgi:hypothetical protein